MGAARSLRRSGGAEDGGGTGQRVGGHVFVLDRVRIEVALEARSRYKYVQPRVLREGEGWQVRSPNCSRNIDPSGGEIPIAWLTPGPQASGSGLPAWWQLHARDHAQGLWRPTLRAPTLTEVLQRLVQDPDREYWQ